MWVLTLLAPQLPAGLLLTLAVAAALAAAGLLLAGGADGVGRAGTLRRVAARGVVIGCLAAVTVTCATAAVRAQTRAASPLMGSRSSGGATRSSAPV